MLMLTYAAESCYAQSRKLEHMKGADKVELQKVMPDVYVYDAPQKFKNSATMQLIHFRRQRKWVSDGNEAFYQIDGTRRNCRKTQNWPMKVDWKNTYDAVVELKMPMIEC